MGRWTDIAPRQMNSSHHGAAMTGHRGVVLHTASGYFEGTISWQMKSLSAMHAAGESATSSHFVVGKNNGEIAQMLDTDVQSWAQKSGNRDWLSIELAGFGEPMTDWQLKCCAQILKKANAVYGVPLQVATSPNGRGLGHHSMGYESGVDWGHQFCPGEKIKAQKPQVVALAQGTTIASAKPKIWSNEEMSGFWKVAGDNSGAVFYGVPLKPMVWVRNSAQLDFMKKNADHVDGGQWGIPVPTAHSLGATPELPRDMLWIEGPIPTGFEDRAWTDRVQPVVATIDEAAATLIASKIPNDSVDGAALMKALQDPAVADVLKNIVVLGANEAEDK